MLASAHFIGMEVDVRQAATDHSYALLHRARDFCVFSLHAQPTPSLPHLARSDSQPTDNVAQAMPRHGTVAVFSFGSVVFFFTPQMRDREEAAMRRWLARLGRYVVERQEQGAGAAEDLQLEVVPEQMQKAGHKQFSIDSTGRVLVARWDRGNLETCARVLGQSVALDAYHSTVDHKLKLVMGVVEQVAYAHGGPRTSSVRGDANPLRSQGWLEHAATRTLHWCKRTMFGRGAGGSQGQEQQQQLDFTSYDRLVALLSSSSAMDIKVSYRLGLLSKEHTPWESEQHDKLWLSFTRSYQIASRGAALARKLEQIKENSAMLLDMRTNAVSHRIEVAITALIATEILLSIYYHRAG